MQHSKNLLMDVSLPVPNQGIPRKKPERGRQTDAIVNTKRVELST
jgi:hypothetical protein